MIVCKVIHSFSEKVSTYKTNIFLLLLFEVIMGIENLYLNRFLVFIFFKNYSALEYDIKNVC